MRFNVLALDYDGTMAEHGQANPEVIEALREARARGLVIVLVTGRIHSDLNRVFSEQDVFDVIVAENGAVLAYPNGQKRLLGRAPAPVLLDDLCEARIEFSWGECVIEADASEGTRILKMIQRRALPLMLVFNQQRVMILPQGITKEVGLREALNTMRLSLHNCIGIGDAENDFALLDACEIGVAVAWGSPSLQAVADHVLPGKGPQALAGYIREVSAQAKLPPIRAAERQVLLGQTRDGPLKTTIHGRNILIAGDPRSGKSWIAGLFCEHLILQGYCLCVIDPEGDYSTLESLPGVTVFGRDTPPPRISTVAHALRYPGVSVVLDLSGLSHEEKLVYVRGLLPALGALRRESGLPHWIVVDEAHYFLHEPSAVEDGALDLAAYVLITYRPSHLDLKLAESAETIIVTPLKNQTEATALATLCGRGMETGWADQLAGLGIDETAMLPSRHATEGEQVLQQFVIAPRLTSHVRHKGKYLDVPLPENEAFVFTCQGRPIGSAARTLNEFARRLNKLPTSSLEAHAARGDFLRWIGGVFSDQTLAEEVAVMEARHREGRVGNLPLALADLIAHRYASGQVT